MTEVVIEDSIEDRVGRAVADRLLGPRWRFAPGWGRRRAPGCLELVRLRVAVRNVAARPTPTGEAAAETRLYVAERVLGHAWAVAVAPPLSTAGRMETAASPLAGAVLPARLDLDAGSSRLEALAMRGALTLGRGRRRALPELAPTYPASYPFWLRYRRDRRGRVRFDALDAVTGRRPGSALRAALAAALIDAGPE
jgi:hypothetical protein